MSDSVSYPKSLTLNIFIALYLAIYAFLDVLQSLLQSKAKTVLPDSSSRPLNRSRQALSRLQLVSHPRQLA